MEAIRDGVRHDREAMNRFVHIQALRDRYPHAEPEVVEIFLNLVEDARRYRALTGRHLDIFGELGELYAEVTLGMKRHKLRAAGSDGRLGNAFIEIKTIGPGSRTGKVRVKRSGNFSRLLVVRISDDFRFEHCMIERKALRRGTGKWITVSWRGLPSGVVEQRSV